MLLRRITEHVRDQNWFAVGLDFFIVVVGVFIGIQVANWNDARAERLDEALVLERLDEDFQLILARTDLSLEQHTRNIAATGRILTGARENSFVEETLRLDVRYVGSFSVPSGPSSTYSELVSAGRLKLIRNEKLRRELKAYDDYVGVVRDEYGTFTGRLTRAEAQLNRALTVQILEEARRTLMNVTPVQAVDLNLLANDPDIRTALQIAYSVQNNVHAILYQNRGRIVEIIDMIEAEKSK